MNVIHTKYFGKLTDVTKICDETITTDKDSTISEFEKLLIKKYPLLRSEKYAIFKNLTKIDDKNVILKNNDELSLMPPFSGG